MTPVPGSGDTVSILVLVDVALELAAEGRVNEFNI